MIRNYNYIELAEENLRLRKSLAVAWSVWIESIINAYEDTTDEFWKWKYKDMLIQIYEAIA